MHLETGQQRKERRTNAKGGGKCKSKAFEKFTFCVARQICTVPVREKEARASAVVFDRRAEWKARLLAAFFFARFFSFLLIFVLGFIRLSPI